MKGRQRRYKVIPSETVAVELLGMIHADVMGPFEVTSCGGARFALTVVDDYSKYSEVFYNTSEIPSKGFYNTSEIPSKG
jgi:hypothetical protein